jgi:hypothetical protein
LRDDGTLGVGFETVYADLLDVHCCWLILKSSNRRWGSMYMRAQCEEIRDTKWSKRADTLNSFSETPTGKRYYAHDVNLYKSVILMIAIACFVVVVVVVLSLSLSLSFETRKEAHVFVFVFEKHSGVKSLFSVRKTTTPHSKFILY